MPQRSYIRPCKRHVRRADLTARFAVVGVEEDVADEQAQVGGPLVSRPRGQRAVTTSWSVLAVTSWSACRDHLVVSACRDLVVSVP